MKRVIGGFEHKRGKNCGSTSIWNISRFYGNSYEEHDIFGLASGILFFYMMGGMGNSSRSISGRNPVLVEDFFDNIGIEKRWQSHEYFPEDKIKNYIDDGIPVLARTDLYYLSYYSGRVHFPGHEVVIFGYEDSNGDVKFILSDSSFDEPKFIGRDELATAMHPPDIEIPFLHLENHIMPVEDFEVVFEPDTIFCSIKKVVQRMCENEIPFMGIKGIKMFAEEIPGWSELPDASWTFRFAYQVIERRGTGGGAFRFMYSDFLKDAAFEFTGEYKNLLLEAHKFMSESAKLWSDLALRFKDVSEKIKRKENLGQEISACASIAYKIYEIEVRAFEKLGKFVDKFTK